MEHGHGCDDDKDVNVCGLPLSTLPFTANAFNHSMQLKTVPSARSPG